MHYSYTRVGIPLSVMDLLLMFFILALLLQGIKALVNYLLDRSEDFNETILSRSSEQEYVNLLSIPVGQENRDKEVVPAVNDFNTRGLDGKPKGKEVFMQNSLHQSA